MYCTHPCIYLRYDAQRVSLTRVCFCLGCSTSVPMVAYLAEDVLYLRLSYYQYQIRRKRGSEETDPEGLDDHQVLGEAGGLEETWGQKLKTAIFSLFVSKCSCSLQCKSSPQKPTLPANLQILQAWVG